MNDSVVQPILYSPISVVVSLVALTVWVIVLTHAVHWSRVLRDPRSGTVALVVFTLVVASLGLTVSALAALVLNSPVSLVSAIGLGVARGALLGGSVAALAYYLRNDDND